MKIEIKCDNCDAIFLKEKGEYNRQKKRNYNHNFFCTRKCYKKSKTLPRIELTCRNCKKVFMLERGEIRKRNKDNAFCSHNCANIFIGENLSEESRKTKSRKAKQWAKNNPEKMIFASNKGFEELRKRGKYFCSKGEIDLFNFIKENVDLKIQTGGGFNISSTKNKHIRKQFDVFCHETKTIIEYDGICHFKPIYGEESFEKTKYKDKLLKEWCIKNEWSLIRIREEIYQKNKKYWQSILLNHINNFQIEYAEYY